MVVRFGAVLLMILRSCVFTAYGEDASSSHQYEEIQVLAKKFCDTFRPDIAFTNPVIKLDSTDAIVTFPIDNGRQAILTVDLKKNEVASFSAFKGFSHKQYPPGATNSFDLEKQGEELIQKLGIHTNEFKRAYASRFKLSQSSRQEMSKYVWQRLQNGFPFKGDFVTLTFDARDGEVLGFKKDWGASPDSFNIKVDLNRAKAIVEKFISKNNAKVQFRSANVVIVSPNDFMKIAQTNSAVRRLAWSIELPRQPEVGDPIELWVDTENGRLLGGSPLNQ
jgi:hypothetical protein